jgi:hypothetical protein
MREETSIDPNDVQQLTTGEMFFAAGGLYQRTQVEMVPIASALVMERKQQLLTLAEQEREHYEAEQAERLVQPAPKTKKRSRQSNQSKPAKAVPAARKQAQSAGLPPVSDGAERRDKQTPAPTSLEDLL